MSAPVLWHISFSNFNEKARWALDYKQIAHVRREAPLGLHPVWAWRIGGGRTFPLLVLDGEAIGDSTRIIEELERRHPDLPLYPAAPADRARALELEDFFDENAGHDMRRVGFWELRENLDYGVSFMTTDQSRVRRAAGRTGLKVAFPFVWRYMSARYAFNEEAVKRSRETLIAALDRIEAERSGGDHLVGEEFSVADLTAASLLYPLVWPAEYQYDLPEATEWEFLEGNRDHPALRWITETWRRHRGTSAAITSPPTRAHP
jgi:glutathione S-transferase